MFSSMLPENETVKVPFALKVYVSKDPDMSIENANPGQYEGSKYRRHSELKRQVPTMFPPQGVKSGQVFAPHAESPVELA